MKNFFLLIILFVSVFTQCKKTETTEVETTPVAVATTPPLWVTVGYPDFFADLKRLYLPKEAINTDNQLTGQIDINNDSLKKIKYLYLNGYRNIKNIEELKYFIGLKYLYIRNMPLLTSLDISNLDTLWIISISLTTLDLSKNPSLTNFVCQYSKLTDLDLSKNTALNKIDIMQNNLINLDISNLDLKNMKQIDLDHCFSKTTTANNSLTITISKEYDENLGVIISLKREYADKLQVIRK